MGVLSIKFNYTMHYCTSNHLRPIFYTTGVTKQSISDDLKVDVPFLLLIIIHLVDTVTHSYIRVSLSET